MIKSHNTPRALLRILLFFPLLLAVILLIFSFHVKGRFSPAPALKESLEGSLLKIGYGANQPIPLDPQARQDRGMYRVVSADFLWAGTAMWSGGGEGAWFRNEWSTGKAIFHCVLEKMVLPEHILTSESQLTN